MKRPKKEFVRPRESGFACDIGEVTPGVTVISAPVFGLREKLIGCVGLIGFYPKGKIQEYGAKMTNLPMLGLFSWRKQSEGRLREQIKGMH